MSLSLLLALNIASVSAQTEQGRFGLSGSISGSVRHDSNGGSGDYSISLSPGGLYFVADALALTPSVSFGYEHLPPSRYLSGSATLGLTYYFGKEELKPLVSCALGTSHSNDRVGKATYIEDHWMFRAEGGVAWFVKNSVALTGTLRYEFTDTYQSSFYIYDMNVLRLLIGVTYIWPK
ncbi:MAG: hypothetical protein JSS75_10000 [Bacteroidetes bacterium]|nr:hypothetical protein [Bacteroidota bacterium]